MSEASAGDSISDLTDWLATPAQAIALLSFRSHSILQELMDTVIASLPHRPSHLVVYDPAHPGALAGTAAEIARQCMEFAATGSPFIFLRPVTGSPDEQEKQNCIDFWKNLNFQREALGSLPTQIILCLDETQRPYAYSYAKDLISWCAPRFNFPDLSPSHGPGLEAIPSSNKSTDSSDFSAAVLTWRTLYPTWASLIASGTPVTEAQAKQLLLPLMNASLEMGMISEALKLKKEARGVEFADKRLQAIWLRLCGDLELARGHLNAAFQYHQDALGIAENLAAHEPENAQWQRDLSVSHNRLGDIAYALGDLPAATKAYTTALEIAKNLVARDPQNTEWQRDLSVSHNKLGDIAVEQDDLPAAATAYSAAIEIRKTLAARDPENTRWQRDLSISYNNLGDIAVAQDDLPAAATAYSAGLEIAKTLAALDPQNTLWQRDLSISHNKLGDIAGEHGDLSVAAKAYATALEIAKTLAASELENTKWQRDLSVSHYRLAIIAEQAGDAAGAYAEYRRSHDILVALLAQGKHVSPQDMEILAMLKKKAGIE